jgi:tetratricopeptide (TPR) repeat protein
LVLAFFAFLRGFVVDKNPPGIIFRFGLDLAFFVSYFTCKVLLARGASHNRIASGLNDSVGREMARMGIQSFLKTVVVVRTQKPAKTWIVVLTLSMIVCLSIIGCTDESAKHCNLGVSLWKKDEYGKAVKEFGKALQINPKNARAYYYRANAFYDDGQYSRAWADVHAAEDLGYRIRPGFLKALRKVTGRER